MGNLHGRRLRYDFDFARSLLILHLGAWYYAPTAWDVIEPNLISSGYAYCRVLVDFMSKLAYWTLEPRDDLASDAYCLANVTSRQYVLYTNRSTTSFTVTLENGSGLNGTWLDPRSGQVLPVDHDFNTGKNVLEVPSKLVDTSDVVLYIH